MAIDVNNSRFLLGARSQGVDFRQTLTLGRLGLFVPPPMLKSLFSEYGVPTAGKSEFFAAAAPAYCEGFFEQLGAMEISSLDFSDYEGATFIHDMNTPIPDTLHGRFDAVVDGGTMEHVFNFPTAIHNAMLMVREGGRLLLDLPANNCMGHGFYQFSPELFFRLFQPEFGYTIERIWLAEDFPFSQMYEARDPAEIHARLMLVNAAPTHVFVQARRSGSVPPLAAFGRYPAQADYTHYWTTNTNPTNAGGRAADTGGWKESLRNLARRLALRQYWRFSVRRNANRDHARHRLNNPQLYHPLPPPGHP